MAIFHLTAQTIGRGSGRSSVAACAYRHGARMTDERTGLIFDYTKKSGVVETLMFLPEGAPAWASDPAKLWNRVEANEKRKDAQTAREINIALPLELNQDQRRALVVEYCRSQFTDEGMVADVAFHDIDKGNPHIHVMLTMRRFDGDGFGQKAREWNEKARMEKWRGQWAEHTNRALEQAGHDARIDHRSLEAQCIAAIESGDQAAAIRLDRYPQKHHGNKKGPDIAALNVEAKNGLAEAEAKAAAWERIHAEEVAKQQEQARTERRAAQQPTQDKPSPTVERDKVTAADTFLKNREAEERQAADSKAEALNLADRWGLALVKQQGKAQQARGNWIKAEKARQAHRRRWWEWLGFGGEERRRLEAAAEKRRAVAQYEAEREKQAAAQKAAAGVRLDEVTEAHARARGGVARGEAARAAVAAAAVQAERAPVTADRVEGVDWDRFRFPASPQGPEADLPPVPRARIAPVLKPPGMR